MQITLTFSDELLKQLLQYPDPEKFIQEAVKTAMQREKPAAKSRWAKLAQRVRDNPISLGDYTEQAKRDGQEFRENFTFQDDLR